MLLPSGLLLLFVSSLAAQKCGNLGSRFFNKRRSLIVGGREIAAQDVPWIMRINGPGKGFFCTGSLISDRHVVSSAHCFTADCKIDFDPKVDWSVCYKEDTNDKECEKTRKYRIKEVHLVDRYLNSNCSKMDIAVLELERPILSAIPICLPHKQFKLSYETEDDSEVHLLGYSTNDETGMKPAPENKRLRHATTKVNLLPREGTPTLVSAYDNNAALCGGDSGGPMFEVHDKKAVLIGVNRGVVGGDCNIDEVFTFSNYPEQRTVELKQHLDAIASVLLGKKK